MKIAIISLILWLQGEPHQLGKSIHAGAMEGIKQAKVVKTLDKKVD